MSRIGRKPINIPTGVEVSVNSGVITVKGSKGTLSYKKVKGKKKITIDPVIGKITIKKGFKKRHI